MNQSKLNLDARKPASRAPSEVVDKIRKLLRMKNGGSDGEVENALRMARQLADRHNIDLATVNAAQESPLTALTHKRTRVSKSSDDVVCASRLIRRFFHVEVIMNEFYEEHSWEILMDMVLIGTQIDIEIAEYVFHFLNAHFKACWRRRNKRIKKRKLFIYGMAQGIASKLKEVNELTLPLIPDQKSLVVSREAYIAQLFPELKNTTVKTPKLDGAAAAAGFGAGRQTNIRQPLAEAPTAARPLSLT